MDSNLLGHWGLVFRRHREDLYLPGSPERCVQRLACEADNGEVYVLERLRGAESEPKEHIARLLSALARHEPRVLTYLPLPDGNHLLSHGECCYRLSRFVHGEALQRPRYAASADMGAELASLLAGVREAAIPATCAAYAQGLPEHASLQSYVQDLMQTLKGRVPRLHGALRPLVHDLREFFAAEASLPRAFCHGDFHPLNIIWKQGQVQALIDWEFTGQRPAAYDAGVCIGCVGSEDPNYLASGLVPAFVRGLMDAGLLDDASRLHLLGLMAAQRFAWMSEWLRRGDAEMISMEVDYIRLLIKRRRFIERAWGF